LQGFRAEKIFGVAGLFFEIPLKLCYTYIGIKYAKKNVGSKYEVQENNRMIAKKNLPACPVATTVGIIGSKWKLLIIRDILTDPKRFGELRKSLAGISQKVLTDSLRAMERDGILTRTVYPEVPPRVEYALSELGETMRPIIIAMEDWGREYNAAMAKE
jgi:DNA-binding HxlR family transcriptional regulator